MKKYLLLLLGCALFTTTTAQKSKEDSLNKARRFENGRAHSSALVLYDALYRQTGKQHPLYPEIAQGCYRSLFNNLQEAKQKGDWSKSIPLAEQLVRIVNDNRNLMGSSNENKKYWACKDLVLANFNLRHPEKARVYQDSLYAAYKRDDLPHGLNACYNFEQFAINNKNVLAYEYYPDYGDPGTTANFAKQVYVVYARDKQGNNGAELFSLEAIRVPAAQTDLPATIVLRKREQKGSVLNGMPWSTTLGSTVDYAKLHSAVVSYLSTKDAVDTRVMGTR